MIAISKEAWDKLVKSRDAWKKLAEDMAAFWVLKEFDGEVILCAFCGSSEKAECEGEVVHSPDCPIEQLRKMKEEEG